MLDQQAHITLIHGLWYGHWFTMPMAHLLSKRGYAVDYFRYPTIARSVEDNAASLVEQINAAGEVTQHIVAHSLGGLVVLAALRQQADLIPGRVVLLGSPLRGSQVARNLTRWPIGKAMLGKAAEALTDGLPDGSDPVIPKPGPEIGMVAGVMRMGLGMVAGAGAVKGDGTVTLEETQDPGLADHVSVNTSHTGLLLSGAVASQVDQFLSRGQFEHGE